MEVEKREFSLVGVGVSFSFASRRRFCFPGCHSGGGSFSESRPVLVQSSFCQHKEQAQCVQTDSSPFVHTAQHFEIKRTLYLNERRSACVWWECVWCMFACFQRGFWVEKGWKKKNRCSGLFSNAKICVVFAPKILKNDSAHKTHFIVINQTELKSYFKRCVTIVKSSIFPVSKNQIF